MLKIGFMGTHCCGKTTMLDIVSKQYPNMPTITGMASVISRDNRNTPLAQWWILVTQIRAERGHHGFISDRTVFDCLAYYRMTCEKQGYIDFDLEASYHAAFARHMQSNPYDIIFHVDEFFPICDNGTRNISDDDQRWVHHFLERQAKIIEGTYGIRVVPVKGSREERIATIETVLQAYADAGLMQ